MFYNSLEELKKSREENAERILNEELSSQQYNNLVNSYKISKDAIAYPDYYGGAYLDAEGLLTVLVKNETEELRLECHTRAQSQDFTMKPAEYSYNELMNAMNYLNTYTAEHREDDAVKNIGSFLLSQTRNRIYMFLNDFSDSSVAAFRQTILDTEMIVFGENTAHYVPQVDVKSGTGISTTKYLGSLAYRAKWNDNVTVGVYTAGHLITEGEYLFKDGTEFAKCIYSNIDGNADCAFCKITNSNYIPSNSIEGSSTAVLSTQITVPIEGMGVYKRGFKTLTTYGTVVTTSYTTAKFTDFILASYDQEEGDSGGLIYRTENSLNKTVGIHSGRMEWTNGYSYGACSKAENVNGRTQSSRY